MPFPFKEPKVAPGPSLSERAFPEYGVTAQKSTTAAAETHTTPQTSSKAVVILAHVRAAERG